MNKYICIHGHFYQPPRENPWLNEVELQETAAPYHDWNERITDECYARNSASRILGADDVIVDIMNNYGYISYNFGPTLLAWLERKQPITYKRILDADKESQRRFSGHGSALAQAYNHMVMPLANTRDKHTQVIWGIYDFRKRFGRYPEGMWLGETAADTETLEVLAEHSITFTILSPYQAKNYRKIGDGRWLDATGAKIDPRRPYLCNLPSGKSIVLFFYNAPVSQAVAFEKLLISGEKFAGKLTGGLDRNSSEPQLMHIATDGETYGHHHRFGEMALSYALYHIGKEKLAKLTIYGEFLEKNPPEYEVQIIENSSWSCAHGVERWRSNCGCHTGGKEGWNQEWRGPLRKAFDWLRDTLEPLYVQEMQKLGVTAPWKTRNAYIEVIMDRTEENVLRFMKEHGSRELNRKEQIAFLRLQEMQYHAMLMYTSCGWFFDEVTGIETTQDIFYAARALQLASTISGKDYEPDFLKLLEKAESNIKEQGNAAETYKKLIKPTMLNMLRVGAHYAVASLFAKDPEKMNLYSYWATSEHYELLSAGRQKLAIGRAKICSGITWEETIITFAVLHVGDHQLFGGVREYIDIESFNQLHTELSEAFKKGLISEVMMLLDKHFQSHNYSFWHLFKDDQRKILNTVLHQTISTIETQFEQVYDNHHSLINAMKELDMTIPEPLQLTVNHIINSRLQQELRAAEIDVKTMKQLFKEASRMNVKISRKVLEYQASKQVTKLAERLEENPHEKARLEKLVKLLKVLNNSPLRPEYWQAQNIVFRLRKNVYAGIETNAITGDEAAAKWCNQFGELLEKLKMKV